jgi:hypothetical protein
MDEKGGVSRPFHLPARFRLKRCNGSLGNIV